VKVQKNICLADDFIHCSVDELITKLQLLKTDYYGKELFFDYVYEGDGSFDFIAYYYEEKQDNILKTTVENKKGECFKCRFLVTDKEEIYFCPCSGVKSFSAKEIAKHCPIIESEK